MIGSISELHSMKYWGYTIIYIHNYIAAIQSHKLNK